MRRSLRDETRASLALSRFSGFLERWWVKFLIIPLLATAPPGILLLLLDLGVKPTGLGETQSLIDYLFEHPLRTVVSVSLYLIAWNALVAFAQNYGRGKEEIDVGGLLTLFEVLERVVGAKAERFGQHVKTADSLEQPVDGRRTFEAITQPEQQIALIASGLHGFFDAIDRQGVNFRVTVAEIIGGRPVGWFYYYPPSEPPRTPIAGLAERDSAISHCLKKKGVVVVESLADEAAKPAAERQYHPRDAEKDEDGSLVCYPILHPFSGTTPYVITIVADKKRYFLGRKRELYKWIFKHFAVRIGLEHSLLILKENVKIHAQENH